MIQINNYLLIPTLMKVPPYLLALFVLMGLFASAKKSQAQTYQPSNRVPIADSTLGTTVIRNADNFAITGGLSRGQNTFHSFQDFSVPTNGAATFANPVGNQSIITRVTGNLFSDINGTINTQGANFLLINPNGVVFGPGTQLNVGRVFAASTANGVDLVDGAGRTLSFGTNTSGDGALLSIDPKVIFNVSRLNLGGGNGEINNFGTLRINNPGQYIGLVGGNVALNGGRIISQTGGRVELGGLSAPGSVGIGIEGTNLRLSYPQDVARANVSLNNSAVINTVGTAGADISINARNIEVLSGSSIASGVRSGTVASGDVKLQATENINIGGVNTIVANTVVFSGNGGNILVDAADVTVQDSASISTSTFGKGSSGNIILTAKNNASIKGSSRVASLVSAGAEGNGGDVSITANSISLQDNSIVAAFLQGKGNNGNITITAKDSTSLVNSSILNFADTTGVGNGGSLKINAGDLSLVKGSIITSTSGQGNVGNIALTAKNIVSTAQNTNSSTRSSIISSSVNTGGIGQGGDINIIADSLSLDRTSVFTSTAGKGNAGSIFVKVKDVGILTNSSLNSNLNEGGNGIGGDININSGSLAFSDGSSVFASTDSQGSTGNINIVAKDNLSFAKSNLFVDVSAVAIGKGGDINISSGSLLLNGASSISNSTRGQGSAGNINIVSQDAVNLAEKSMILDRAETGSIGGSGAINISATSLSVNDSVIRSVTRGQGSTKNTNILIEGGASLANRASIENIVDTGGIGSSGDINITAGSLIADNSIVFASTFGQGNASNVNLKIKDAFNLSNATVFSDVSVGGVGNGGNIDITAGSLSFTKASQLISSVRAASATNPAGRGNAGNITVKVAELANFDTSVDRVGSGLFTSTEAGTEGNGGNINVQASNISLKDGSGFQSTTAGKGNSGNVTVTATDKVSFNGLAGVLSRVETTGIGNAGDINVNGSDISFRNGAALTAETLGQGNAGNITVDASNSIFLSGEGNNTRVVFLLDRGGIFARSQSSTGIPGNITVTAPKITLDNGGLISSQSNFGGGGNIAIGSKNATDLFFLRRGSQVATDAGVTAQQGGDGGNININANFIFAVPKENSDISANAAKGRGGNVNVNSQGLFGIQQRFQPSSNSDITASSSFGQNGIVNINTPGIDPGKDTSELPSAPTDASRQITQTCNSSQVGNRFYVTGRGGHPATSEDSLTQEVVWLDPRNPRTSPTIAKSSNTSTQSPQPAVSWAFNGKGKVALLVNSTGEFKRANVTCPNSSH
jgi:filamentous hemagglutinin family protein